MSSSSNSELKVDAIVFDFDGVLTESVDIKGRAFYRLYEHEGEEFARKILKHHISNGGISRFDKIRTYEEDFLERSVSEEQIQEIADRFSYLVEAQVVEAPFVPGAKEFLDEFHMLLPLYVASAAPQEELVRIIEKRGMKHYFKGVYGSPKRKADHLKDIAYIYGPARTLMIGDAVSDYRAAQEAGTPFIARAISGNNEHFPPGVFPVPDLTVLKGIISTSNDR